MDAAKPLIAILMAVYEPRLDWLKEQLASLEAQTYPNLRLYVRDDCSPTVPFGDIQKCIRSSIHSFPYEIQRNEKNVGPSTTFAWLSEEAEGEYFAFCDQDDVWLPEKLEKLKANLEESHATLAYCGLSVIGPDGKDVATDIRNLRKRDSFPEGTGLAPQLLVKNSIYGCTTLFPADVVRRSLPLPECMGYDHWFSLWAAKEGRIVRNEQPLIRYRFHGNNTSVPFRSIRGKRDYVTQRIELLEARADVYAERFSDSPELLSSAAAIREWAEARKRWVQGDPTAFAPFWKGRKLSPAAFLFELPMPVCSERVFASLLRRFQK